VVHALRRHGWEYAGRSHDGRPQAGRGDIINGPAGTSVEVKFTQRAEPWKWWEQAERDAQGLIPIIAFRRSRSPWLTILELEELLPLLALREMG
jgi:hypothetical protein